MPLTAYQSVILLAAALAPALPPIAGGPLAAVALILWWRSRPPWRELAVAVPLLALAIAAFAIQAWVGPRVPEKRLAAAAAELEATWAGLEAAASAAAADLEHAEAPLDDDRAAFAHLEALVSRPPARTTWYLLDADGFALAWAGPGLLHDLRAGEGPPLGRSLQAGHTAVTLLATGVGGEGAASWRLVAGRSLPTDRLPGEDPQGAVGGWALDATDDAGAGTPVGDGPLFLVPREPPLATRSAPMRDLPPYLIAVALILVGLLRLTRDPGGRRPMLPTALAMAPLVAGAALLADTADAERWAVLLLVVAIAALVLARPARPLGGTPWLELGIAPVVTALLLAGAWWVQAWAEPLDLAAALIGPAHQATVRLAFLLLTLAVLRTIPLTPGGRGERSRWAWAALTAIGIGAAFHALPVVGVLGLALGVWLTLLWCRDGRPARRWTGVAVLALLAGTLSGLAWEIAFHEALERDLEERVLAELVPPSAAELAALGTELDDHFGELRLASGSETDPDAGDLAYALWRDSPLGLEGRLSALVVLPVAGTAASFSFGLPLTDDGFLERTPPLWEDLRLPGWSEALVSGESTLLEDGLARARVRYWVMLRPGFRHASDRLEGVAEGLLRGGPVGVSTAELLPGDVRLGLYSPEGAIGVAPWRGAPDLDPAVGVPPIVHTPELEARAIAARGPEGWRVLYLPIPPPLAGVERIATHAVGPLLALAAALAVALTVNLGRPELRAALEGAWRSYSRRLLILYTVILVVPVILGNVFLLRVLGERLEREDRAAGEAALESAQRVLGEYALTLDPGFEVETALDDELLLWLSRVLHFEVNLYWGSEVYASSKPELFSAGLLPRRIPGEIFRRLALEGSSLASRASRAVGGSSYQESYAPLRVPGAPTLRPNLFLSTPLLAQEVERARQMASLRRRVVLITAGLVFLLAALGTGLARRFTEPLMEIVEGTQRIAAGSASLDFRPRETELATLAAAIDEMASKIALGRERLVAEKRLIDTVVENITAGVVSVDQEGRVLLLNRHARDLLGLEVGSSLIEQLEARERLAPVAEFLRGVSGRSAQTTFRIRDEGEAVTAESSESEWTGVWVPVPGSTAPAALLVLEDVTEVLRGQRLEAWAEMARMIAHEIKNPLTPIRLSTEHLREVYRRRPLELDEIFERCTDNILVQVEELRAISSEFSTYSHIPRADLEVGDLAAALERIVDGYRVAPPEGVRVDWVRPDGGVEARFDERLLGRAVRNLLENAVRATTGAGRVEVALETDGVRALLTVADDGPGVEKQLLSRIFEPYFSTDDSGTGLGLPIARKIVEEHGGTIEARNRPGPGLAVVVTLPVTPNRE